MRIGLDVHGVIDRFPQQFADLSSMWVKAGHEVHIVTGQVREVVLPQVERMGVSHTHFFSIVDHHRSIGTPMELKDSSWWMSERDWIMTKGQYASRVGLDVHFEDSLEYAPWFPPSCTFLHVGKDFATALDIFQDLQLAFDQGV